jgi:hypothetical protein
LRKAARATRAVSSGTGSIGVGLRDMAGLRGGPGTDPREIGRPPGRARFRQQIRRARARTIVGRKFGPLFRPSFSQQYPEVFGTHLLRLMTGDQVPGSLATE